MIFQMCTEYNGPHTRMCPAPDIHALKQSGPDTRRLEPLPLASDELGRGKPRELEDSL